MGRNDMTGTRMVIDEELASVLDQVCIKHGMKNREEAMNFLTSSNLNGTLKRMIAGYQKPKLTVIEGGKQ